MDGQKFCNGCERQRPLAGFSGRHTKCRDCMNAVRRKFLARPTGPLSRAQIQIAELMCLGKTNPQMGEILNRSPLTVKRHVQFIIRKLEAPNRTRAAVLYATKKLKEEI